MVEERLKTNKLGFSISIATLKDLVNKWLMREHGSDDIDFYDERGGDEWLKNGLQTDFKNGIKASTIKDRIDYYGSNAKDVVKIKTIW